MRGRRPARAARTKRLWWWLGGAVAIAVAITVVAVSTSIGAPAPSASTPATTAGTTATTTPTTAVTPTLEPTPTPTPSATTTPTPSATSTRPVKKAAYCAAFAKIKTRSVTANTDGGGVDFDELYALFGSLITSYSAAAKSAPSSLDTEYAQVLGYLKEMRQAVKSRDLEGIKLMIKNLALLNDAMTSIQTQSEKICG